MSSDSQHRIFLFLERLWLFAAILGAALTAYYIIRGDNDSALFFLGFFVLSGLFFLLRRRQRVRYAGRIQGLSQGQTTSRRLSGDEKTQDGDTRRQ